MGNKGLYAWHVDVGPKRFCLCFLPRGLAETPVGAGAAGPALSRLDPRKEEMLALGTPGARLGQVGVHGAGWSGSTPWG